MCENHSNLAVKILATGDDSNGQVASGVYLYRIHTGQFNTVKKLLLLK